MNHISRPVQNISSFASRAQASYMSRPRALGVYGCVRILCGGVRLWDGPQPSPKGRCRKTIVFSNVLTIPAGCSRAGIHEGSRRSWNPPSRASFPGQCQTVSAYASRAGVFDVSRTRVGVYGGVRFVYGLCTELSGFRPVCVPFWDAPIDPVRTFPYGHSTQLHDNCIPCQPRAEVRRSAAGAQASRFAVSAPQGGARRCS